MDPQDRNIYLYWVGKEYKLISILRNMIYLHTTNGVGYKVNLITDKNIREYIKDIPDYFSSLCPAHQADFVRVHVICDYGGIWLDSDTLVLDSLDSLFELIEKKTGFFIKENNTILWNGIFGSKKRTPLMIEWKKNLNNILNKKKEKIEWAEVGCQMLQSMYNINPSLYNDYKIFEGLNNLYPVNWNNCITEFIEKPYDNYKNIVREYQPLVVLVNSVYKKLENKTINEILNGNMPINYFINKSYEKINYKMNDNKKIFTEIYKNGIWNNNNSNIPLSGPGSSLENTREITALLEDFIYKYNCNSILDLGCGDLSWMQKTKFFLDDNIKYTGVDVVDSLIDIHNTNYPNRTFLCEDITEFSEFNKVSIILMRDVIFHLKNNEILKILNNIKNGFDFICITSCKNSENNDIFNKWRFSEKNLHLEPFNITDKYKYKIFEKKFNRNLYIYEHSEFY
tara:strand:- start:8397 stop:9758 length:1362 start_codon:yes stop_codon:yes gene_type:complete